MLRRHFNPRRGLVQIGARLPTLRVVFIHVGNPASDAFRMRGRLRLRCAASMDTEGQMMTPRYVL